MIENFVKVSVCMITYNHETYISDAIEGVLMQKTNFPIELIIGEDCSTDNTRNICIEYQQKYPDIIKLRLPEKNLGVMPNFIETLSAGSGKYIALCEGDDYWTDPLKLQKQVDFMEMNDALSFCFHNATVYFVDNNLTVDFNEKMKSGIRSTNDILLNEWFIPTASVLLRSSMLPNPFPKWYYEVYNGDYGLELLLSIKGKFYYFNDKMSVYQRNALNSLSVNGLNGMAILKKKLFLLNEFKRDFYNKFSFAILIAFIRIRIVQFRVYIYINIPFVEMIKNKLIYGNFKI